MLLVEAVDAYLYLARMTPTLAESEDAGIGEIAAKAALGDGNAIGQLFVHYQRPLTKIAAAMVGADLAQDVVQDIFVRMSKGSFAKHAPAFKADGRSAWLMLASAVKNLSRNVIQKRSHEKPMATTGDDDEATLEPEDRPQSGPSAAEVSVVAKALQRAKENAKLSPAEHGFIDALLAAGALTGGQTKGAAGVSIKDLAQKFWPDKAVNAAEVSAVRARKRFLSQLCQDPEINRLLPTGHARSAKSSFFGAKFKPLCDEQVDPVLRFAAQLGLLSADSPNNVDRIYEDVLRWVYHRVA